MAKGYVAYAVKTGIDGLLRVIEFDLRKIHIEESDFDDLRHWLAVETDGSVSLHLDMLDNGMVFIFQNELQYRTTSIFEVQHKIERILQKKQITKLDL